MRVDIVTYTYTCLYKCNILYYYILSYGPNAYLHLMLYCYLLCTRVKKQPNCNQFPYYNECKCVHAINI